MKKFLYHGTSNGTLNGEFVHVVYSTRGGGVLIAVDRSVSSQLIDCPKELELLLIQIGIKHPTRICVVYNPPNSCVEHKQSLIAYLDNLAANRSPLILKGISMFLTLIGILCQDQRLSQTSCVTWCFNITHYRLLIVPHM